MEVDQARDALGRFTKAAGDAEAATTRLAATSRPAAGSVAGDMLKIENSAIKGEYGLGRVERQLVSMGIQAAGLTGEAGHIGHLVATLASLGEGGAVVLGLVGGFTLMTLVMQKFGEAAEEQKQHVHDLFAESDKLRQSAEATLEMQKVSAQTALDAAIAAQAKLLKEGLGLVDRVRNVFGGPDMTQRLLEGKVAIDQAQQALDVFTTAQLGDAKRLLEAWNDIHETARRALNDFTKASDEAARKFFDPMLKAADAAERWRMSFSDGLKDLQRFGLVAKPGEGDALIDAETRANTQRLRDAGMLVDATYAKLSASEKTLVREMQRDFASFFDDLLSNGLSSFDQLFTSVRQMFTKLVADLAAQKLMDKLTTHDAKGELTGVSSTLGGAGLVVGAVGLALSWNAESNRQMEAAAVAVKAFTNSLADMQDQLRGNTDAIDERKIIEQADAQREAAKALVNTIDGISKYTQALIDIYQWEYASIAALRAAIEAKKQEAQQDLQVRLLRAQGFTDEADALAMSLAQQREYAAAVKDGTDLLGLETLQRVQAAETAKRILDQQITDTQKQLSAQTSIRDAFKQTTDALRAYSLQLRVGAGSPVQNLAEARKQFDDLVARARAGDQDAARQLPQFGQQFLDLSRQYNASGMGYQQDLKYVTDLVDSLGDKFSVEQQLAQESVDLLQQILDELQKQNATSGPTVVNPHGNPPPGGFYPYDPNPHPNLPPPGDLTGTSVATGQMTQSGLQAVVTEVRSLRAEVSNQTQRLGLAIEGIRLGRVS